MKRKYISVHCFMMVLGKLRIHRDEIAKITGEDSQIIADFDDEISIFESALKNRVIEIEVTQIIPDNICTVCNELEKDGEGICYYLSNKYGVAMRPEQKSKCVGFKRSNKGEVR